jgi:3-oxoacyl-[acyl-carrier protein] reductase
MDVTFNFTGRTLVLSGATGGIGRAVARLFAEAGANLVLTDYDGAALETFAQELGLFDRVAVLQVNVTDPASAAQTVQLAMERFGGIDFLVPSAGIYQAQPFAEMSDADWQRTISVNLDGVFYLIRRAVGALRPESSVILLSSLAAQRGAFSNAHYAATKGAMIALARSLARELAPQTRVNGVAPGIIDTPMIRELMARRGDETLAQTPLGRLGTPEEIASVIGFLCSSAAGFITGETVQANGGLYMA